MGFQWDINLMWWITGVEIPALAGLFWLIWRARCEGQASLLQFHRQIKEGTDEHRQSLAAFKLEVAKSYASIAHLKDVETRLTRHLQRIEDKLDDQIGRRR
ncbi:MAG: hypothetical protein J4G10_05410 [Alphaproteobacteria bacterium]|nr:hypothetical protein [Alphaproteobacteria bacterium]